jgi:hypothetical protein
MFYISAIWDEEAKVFYSESDILGLHIEAETLEEFERVMNDMAADLIMANHVTKQDLSAKSLRDLIPSIKWQPPSGFVAA